MSEFESMVEGMREEAELIGANRQQRNRKYGQCMASFRDFLSSEAQMLEESAGVSAQQKDLVSQAFENTFSRILASSDVTVRRIKQTYHEKKEFWDNVIKLSANVPDIELKKEFYLQKRNAEEAYFEAADHQKDKHKPYALLMNKAARADPLRDFQNNNKQFEQKVVQGTNTLQQWQNMSAQGRSSQPPYQPQPQSSLQGTVINQFVAQPHPKSSYPDSHYAQPYSKKQYGLEEEGSFLNNFTRKF